MATEFIIKKGRSTVLFDENGTCRIASDKLIENGWYLTTDTAEVYVALRSVPNDSNSPLTLRKLNECNTDIDFPDVESFETRIEKLESDHTHTYGYRKDFPVVGEINHLYIASDLKRTYVYSNGSYLPIADQFDTEDHDNDPDTPNLRIIYGGSAN